MNPYTIVMIDDDVDLCRSLEIQLSLKDITLFSSHLAEEGLALIEKKKPDLILLDLNLPDARGTDVLISIKQMHPTIPVAMITGEQDMEATIRAFQNGVIDFLRKPFELEDITALVRSITDKQETETVSTTSTAIIPSSEIKKYEIIGADKRVLEILKQISLLSRTKITVLIRGENGTGKELVARALHTHSKSEGQFVALNCGAIPEALFESELFGHTSSAFTGAKENKDGLVAQAQQGTLFLDEIGDMPLSSQVKLLRLLQEGEYTPVGSTTVKLFKGRIIAATNKPLETMIAEKSFREDLFFRLAVASLTIPPLRERTGDLPLLIAFLIGKINKEYQSEIRSIDTTAMESLQAHSWPGNIRELENVLTRAAALCEGSLITLDGIELRAPEKHEDVALLKRTPQQIPPLADSEKKAIAEALHFYNGNITHTAQGLQISPTTLRKKIKDYDL